MENHLNGVKKKEFDLLKIIWLDQNKKCAEP